MRYFVIALFIAGVVLLAIGFRRNGSASFDDETLLYDVISIIMGFVCLAISLIIVIIQYFANDDPHLL